MLSKQCAAALLCCLRGRPHRDLYAHCASHPPTCSPCCLQAGASTPVVGYETLEQLCDALLPRLRSHNADGLSPQDAAAAAWAFAQLRHPNTQLFKALAELLEPRLRDLVAGDTIAVAVAMIQAGWASTALLRGLSRRLWWLMPTLGAAEVAQVRGAGRVQGSGRPRARGLGGGGHCLRDLRSRRRCLQSCCMHGRGLCSPLFLCSAARSQAGM